MRCKIFEYCNRTTAGKLVLHKRKYEVFRGHLNLRSPVLNDTLGHSKCNKFNAYCKLEYQNSTQVTLYCVHQVKKNNTSMFDCNREADNTATTQILIGK